MEDLKFKQDVVERLARIETRFDGFKEQQTNLIEQLFGNGQPGIIARYGRRITKLEIALWSCIGGGSVILFLFEAFFKGR